ncbi:TetR/AcrR family transcriptional regulator [Lacrimispora saccharolytica]|uniref:Transcriptional regulator, TetR family n=1 Tax=Lacrimispora saccharolytica (strain ATCC 35040 / DSM 2544 / NRCC 2533 / WM1) TaxID=610130 RepID=D9R3J7_LACSW|nr:TetR/AcrR family transcriptional regulator [Lacrimispora saccharolytica]ADL06718.1 transcriptional regulator, TetR family [[Clostridium] saccharolyticum WM1]QRV19214.1 TetR/AcrR family transcriptional regulator [Lacrimispora saccharolytica]
MEKLKELSEEKRQPILEAALKCFGKHGYKKASMGDIAKSSGISKPMLFHYFGTKKDLYLSLSEYVRNVMVDAYKRNEIDVCGDLFERITAASRMKMGILEKDPHILKFIISMVEETDEEVIDITKRIMPEAQRFSYDLVVKKEDAAKFKEGVDIDAVMRLMFLMAEGYAYEMSNGRCDLLKIMEELEKTMHMLKSNLYKEEYL